MMETSTAVGIAAVGIIGVIGLMYINNMNRAAMMQSSLQVDASRSSSSGLSPNSTGETLFGIFTGLGRGIADVATAVGANERASRAQGNGKVPTNYYNGAPIAPGNSPASFGNARQGV